MAMSHFFCNMRRSRGANGITYGSVTYTPIQISLTLVGFSLSVGSVDNYIFSELNVIKCWIRFFNIEPMIKFEQPFRKCRHNCLKKISKLGNDWKQPKHETKTTNLKSK